MIVKFVVGLLTCATSVFVIAGSASALKVDDLCADVELVYAMGSGQDLGSSEFERFRTQAEYRVQIGDVTTHTYQLGAESYNGAQYDPVDVSNLLNGHALGAKVSSGKAFDYGNSVATGKKEMKAYLDARMNKCKDAVFVLGGYSQGAHVVRDGVAQLLYPQRDRIAFIALFGDPRLYLPEGEGLFPQACYGKDFSNWRRTIGNCRAHAGSLGAQKPYVSGGFDNKVGLWCNAKDFVCGGSPFVWERQGHGEYALPGNAIDNAAKEIAEKVKAKLPSPKPNNIDTKPRQGDGITGQDVVFLVEVDSTNQDRMPRIREQIRSMATRLENAGDRIALISYGATSRPPVDDNGNALPGYPPFTPFINKVAFEEDTQEKLEAIDNLRAYDLHHGSPLHAMRTAFDTLNWRKGAAKSIVLFVDTKVYEDPDYNGDTNQSILKRAAELGSVSVFPIVPEHAHPGYVDLVEKSSGRVIKESESISLARHIATPAVRLAVNEGTQGSITDEVVSTIYNRPVVLFDVEEYMAPRNQEIAFSASKSYAIDSSIKKYEWDFNGDSEFEKTTSIPQANYRYATDGKHVVFVKVTAENGMTASGSIVVKVGSAAEQPALPIAPKDLAVVADSLESTSAKLQWEPADQQAHFWVVSVNGVALGKVPASQTGIEISDLDRTENITFSIAGLSAEQGLGASASSVLEGKNPPPSESEPPICNTGNYLNDTLCRYRLWYDTVMQQTMLWWTSFLR